MKALLDRLDEQQLDERFDPKKEWIRDLEKAQAMLNDVVDHLRNWASHTTAKHGRGSDLAKIANRADTLHGQSARKAAIEVGGVIRAARKQFPK